MSTLASFDELNNFLANLPARGRIAGIPVDPVVQQDIVRLFELVVKSNARFVMAHLNLHGLYCAYRFPAMRSLLTSPNTIVHIDGMPLVWLLKPFIKGLGPENRNTSLDYMALLFEKCQRESWNVVMIGSDPAGALQNEATFKELFPSLNIHCFDGYFDLNDFTQDSVQLQLVQRIQALKPKMILVGLGMPKQEIWISWLRTKIDCPFTVPVGGYSDYVTKRTKIPPRHLGPKGFEWLFRLYDDPSRLGFRYLIEPFMLFGNMIVATYLGQKWGKDNLQRKYLSDSENPLRAVSEPLESIVDSQIKSVEK